VAFWTAGPRNARIAPASLRLDTFPALGYNLPMKLSARNNLVGEVIELHLGDVMAHVVVKVGDNLVESVITRRSAEELNLKVGDTVGAIIKSTEVMLQKA
jgi:molybdopterin-binding protein